MSELADPAVGARRRGHRRGKGLGRSLSWRSWPLRTRLLVPAVLVLAALCAVITSVTWVVLRANLESSVSTRLGTVVEHAIGVQSQVHDQNGTSGMSEADEFTLLFKGPGMDSALGAFVSQNGAVKMAATQTTSFNAPATDLTAAQSAALTGSQNWHDHIVTIPGLGDYMVTAVHLPQDGGGQNGEGAPQPPAGTATTGDTIVVGLPMSGAESTLNTLVASMAVLSFAGILGAALLFSWITRLALRPLDRVAATATRVSQLPLHRGEVRELERVPQADTDPRTEVGQVGAALNVLLDHVGGALAARHASEMRVRQFVADASHELRTPLASIKGYAELTRRGGEVVPPDTAYALQRVESEAERMSRLVEDLLLLARLDSGRPLDRDEVDLVPLVVDTVRDAHAAGPRHRWAIDLPGEDDEPPVVVGDAHRLQQVLVNLLANARTHTPPGTTVTTSVSREYGDCVLRVADDGPGIPPDFLPRIFERFARGDASRSRAAGSTGLGLAIVSAVVASHGGTVDVDSVPGRTVFTVRLPAAPVPVRAPVPAFV
jgi:two-component system OmpR family sensor kinase